MKVIKIGIVIVLLAFVAFVSYSFGKMVNRVDKTPYQFTDNKKSLVEAYGTFLVKDQNGAVLTGDKDPTGVNGHTVDITCDQSTMVCNETQAYLGPNMGYGSNFITIGNPKTYSIDQWSDNTILSKPLEVDSCTMEVLEIDRFSKLVTVKNSLSSQSGSCASLPKDQIIMTVQ